MRSHGKVFCVLGLEFVYILYPFRDILPIVFFFRGYGGARVTNSEWLPRASLFSQGAHLSKLKIKQETKKFAFSRELIEYPDHDAYEKGKCNCLYKYG